MGMLGLLAGVHRCTSYLGLVLPKRLGQAVKARFWFGKNPSGGNYLVRADGVRQESAIQCWVLETEVNL
jgi:hypothetical protein